MDKRLAKRLLAATPEGGMFDLQFGGLNSPERETIASTVILTLVNKPVDGKPGSISNRITLTAVGAKIADAQKKALNEALLLLGV